MPTELNGLLLPLNGAASAIVLVVLYFMRDDLKDVKRRIWRIEKSYFHEDEKS